MRLGWLLAVLLVTPAMAGLATSQGAGQASPHVLVGMPDTGINPYHEAFHQPERVEHPCTYVPRIPCSLPSLELTLGTGNRTAALEADSEVWASVAPGTWYWIPQTPFVAVACERESAPGDHCLLDDATEHGTATTSTLLAENPQALIAFKAGGSSVTAFLEAGLPIDLFSVSWGSSVPLPERHPVPGGIPYVLSAGNDARPTLIDGWAGNRQAIVVGGAYSDPPGLPSSWGQEEALSAKQVDVVSHHCRPVARADAAAGTRQGCGTSFAAPTVAGALSEAILAVRETSGYTGGFTNGVLDPLQGLTPAELRAAMNRTATYAPEPRYEARATGLPLNPAAPWLQWGWGFFDGRQVATTVAHLLGTEPVPAKEPAAQAHMALMWQAKAPWDTGEPIYRPTARFTASCHELACTLDASASSDPHGQALTYSWSLPSGTATGRVVDRAFPSPGGHPVTLTVSDGQLTHAVTRTVLTVPWTAELAVSTDQATYAPDQPVTVHLEAHDPTTGAPLPGLPLEVRTSYAAGQPTLDGLLQAPITEGTLQTAGLVDHRTELTTGPDGTATWTVPASTPLAEASLPTPAGWYDVRAQVDDPSVSLGGYARYVVEAIP